MSQSVQPNGFYSEFWGLLQKINSNHGNLAGVNINDALSIFDAVDKSDGATDGKVNADKFTSQLLAHLGVDSSQYGASEYEFSESMTAWAGSDGELTASDINGSAGAVADSYAKGGENETKNYANSHSYEVNKQQYGNMALNNPALNSPSGSTYQRQHSEPVSAFSLSGKDADTLRSERSNLNGEISAVRSEMDSAKAQMQSDVDSKKQVYDEALSALNEQDTIQDDNGNTMKTLTEQKNAKEGEISAQNGVVSELTSAVSAQQTTISGLDSQISAHENDKPDKNDFMKTETDSTGQTKQVVDEARYQAALADWQNKKDSLENEKKAAEDKLSSMEQQLGEAENALNILEAEAAEIDNQISELSLRIQSEESGATEAERAAASAISQALNEYQEAQSKLASFTAPYEADIAQMQADLGTYDTAISNVKQFDEMPVVQDEPYDFSNPDDIYEAFGLADEGLDKDVFSLAMDGYENLPDSMKESGYFGIFDAIHPDASGKRYYYLLDLKNNQYVGKMEVLVGKGKGGNMFELNENIAMNAMSNMPTANTQNSNATLSGFETVGKTYNGKHGKSRKIVGVEDCNDQAEAKLTVIHSVENPKQIYTEGCKGFRAVTNSDGSKNVKATEAQLDKFFPEGAVMFTSPVNPEEYRNISRFV